MAQTKAHVEAKAWGNDFAYQPYLIVNIREGDEIVDSEYKYLGKFRNEADAVKAVRSAQGLEYGYVERYRWELGMFDDDEYGTVHDADAIVDDSYYLEVEPA